MSIKGVELVLLQSLQKGSRLICILASSFYPRYTSLQASTGSPPLACLDYVPISAWASLPSWNAVL